MTARRMAGAGTIGNRRTLREKRPVDKVINRSRVRAGPAEPGPALTAPEASGTVPGNHPKTAANTAGG